MRKFRVHHKKDMMFRYNEADKMVVFDFTLYDWVANVRTHNLGDVFRVTNHIDEAWWENPEIIDHKESRSTSVGDVVHDVEADVYHLCMPCGWKELMSYEAFKAEVTSLTYFPVCDGCEHGAFDYETNLGCYTSCRTFKKCGEAFLKNPHRFYEFMEEQDEIANQAAPF